MVCRGKSNFSERNTGYSYTGKSAGLYFVDRYGEIIW
jgi:hypothetical protein